MKVFSSVYFHNRDQIRSTLLNFYGFDRVAVIPKTLSPVRKVSRYQSGKQKP
jgi:hypothetical protein